MYGIAALSLWRSSQCEIPDLSHQAALESIVLDR
jgi:hypothetical protein